MRLHTKYHGDIDIDENKIISFENGIPGFLEEKKFVMLPFGEDSVFSILQSVETSQLAFVIASPFTFFTEYDFTLDDQVVEQLHLESEKEIEVYVILTVQDPFENTTANLQGPIVMNSNKRLGKRVILTNTTFKTRHSIFEKGAVTAK